MNLNTVLSELLLIADQLDNKKLDDIAADLDAAIFILSSDEALPLNKSTASMIREVYATLENADNKMLEDMAVDAATEFSYLQEEMLKLEPRTMVAVLKAMTHSLRSILNPEGTVTECALKAGSDLLADAERKLLEKTDLTSVGYRVGVVRARLEEING